MITGSAGEYKLDEYGDRDVVFSVIYTNTNNEVSNKSSTIPMILFTREITEMWKSFIKVTMTESTHCTLLP